MPNAAGKVIAEDIVTLLESKPNPMDMGRHLDVLTVGMADLVARLKNLEFAHLKYAHDVSALDTRVLAAEERARVLEGDRDEYKKRLDAVEKAPIADAKKLEDLGKRVSTVEGAVGSTGFKEAKAAPAAGKPLPLSTGQASASAATPGEQANQAQRSAATSSEQANQAQRSAATSSEQGKVT